jgi:hypothetical protein
MFLQLLLAVSEVPADSLLLCEASVHKLFDNGSMVSIFPDCARSPHFHNSTVLKLRRILQDKLQYFNIPTSIIFDLQAYYSPLHAPLSDPLREGSDS